MDVDLLLKATVDDSNRSTPSQSFSRIRIEDEDSIASCSDEDFQCDGSDGKGSNEMVSFDGSGTATTGDGCPTALE